MLSLSLGPLVLSSKHLLLLLAFASAWFGGWLASGRRQNIEPLLFRLLLLGLLVARLAFVMRYWTQYRDEAWRVIDIRDGGFLILPGLLAAVLGAMLWAWKRPPLRRPLGAGMAAGLALWLLGSLALSLHERGSRLPELSLLDIHGNSVELRQFAGKPLVINLWATWCPPCRREMPVLQAGQHNHPEIVFLFANQGESAATVQDFLRQQKLALDNLLLDSGGRLARAFGSQALPTTVFYDADGRLLGSHLGELSHASLARQLERLQPNEKP